MSDKIVHTTDSAFDADVLQNSKAVLLDFWAVWCGPCIATFPHLREWQEKYGEKGLVMIGVTNYYNFEWDDTAGRAKRSMGQVAHEAEHEMLKKFATHYKTGKPIPDSLIKRILFAPADDNVMSAFEEFFGESVADAFGGACDDDRFIHSLR